ncbi:cytochrome P450 [Chiua virens]|nr:cytochrome P450 [Chiua virens]
MSCQLCMLSALSPHAMTYQQNIWFLLYGRVPVHDTPGNMTSFPTCFSQLTFPTFSRHSQAFKNFDVSKSSFLALVVAGVVVAKLYERRQVLFTFKTSVPLPPGPPAKWFWENALPSVNIAHTLAEWVVKYGSVIALRQGSHIIIVVGRADAATDIMEQEGSALADRPRSVAAGEILSRGMRFVLMRSGERLRRYRKAAHIHLQPKAVRAYQELQMEHAKDVVKDILRDPKNHLVHVQRYAASVVLRLTYGKSAPTSNDDPELARINQVIENVQHALRPGAFLVDRIPWLKYFPWYGRRLKEYHDFEIRLFRDHMNRVQSDMEANEGGNSFMRTLLEHVDSHQLSKDEMAYVAGNLFGAGTETTANAVTNMILAAACYPEAQRRVQEELDRVVGNDRLPNWEDFELLPQVHAFVLETLRWRPVTPIGFAHRATRDIVWRGQCIPAGATVIGCHWAISRDPAAFPDPDKFDPQRWIDKNGKLRDDMTSYPYGFGRRVCPGIHLANRSLQMNLSLLLWSFRIVERPDAPIDVNAFTDTVLSHAAPFDVKFSPRIEEGRLGEMMSGSEEI